MPLVDDLKACFVHTLWRGKRHARPNKITNEAAEALERLNGFARHEAGCAADLFIHNSGPPGRRECTCGLSTLRAEIFGETSDGN